MRMTAEKLRTVIESAAEGPKLDFKWHPWDLDDSDGKGEFIKDLTAMANTTGNGVLGGEEAHIIIGVKELARGVYRPAEVESKDPTSLPLNEERLQQIAQSGIVPSLNFEYKQFLIVGYPVGVLEVKGIHRPYCIANDCGKARKGQFYVRRGSTTVIATREELRGWFHPELLREIESLKRQIEHLKAGGRNDWTMEHLDSSTEYIRHVPCIFLEMWEKKRPTLSIDELVAELEKRFGLSFKATEKGLGIAAYTRRSTQYNLDELFVKVGPGRGRWQLNEKYIPLVRRYRDEVVEEKNKADWTLEIIESFKAESVRALPCVFLEKLERTGSSTMTNEDLHQQIEKRLGKEVRNMSYLGIWSRRQKKYGLKTMFIQVERGRWRLNPRYHKLLKQFCAAQ